MIAAMRRSVLLLASLLLGCGPDEASISGATIEIAFVRVHEDGSMQLRGFSPGQADVALAPAELTGVRLEDPCWSADGRLLAFVREPDADADPHIHLLDPKRVESWPLTDGRAPAWSPTRAQLGFLLDTDADTELHVIDVDSQAQARVGTSSVSAFSWAPDGERMVVLGTWPAHDSNRALYIVEIGSGEVTRIDPDPPNATGIPSDSAPTWSADGSTIAFISSGRTDLDFEDNHLFRMAVDGSGLEGTANQYGYGVRRPVWSPVGRRLAYEYWEFDAIVPTDYGVGFADESLEIEGGRWLAWSPDATQVAVVEAVGYGTRIRVLASDESSAWDEDGPSQDWYDLAPAWRRLP